MSPGRRHIQSRRLRSRSSLVFERLEDRRLLALVAWDGDAADNNWSTAANWDNDQLPGATDDVVIGDRYRDVTVVHASGTTRIRSLMSAAHLSHLGGRLEVAEGGQIQGDFLMGGGNILNGTITVQGNSRWQAGSISTRGHWIAAGGLQIGVD